MPPQIPSINANNSPELSQWLYKHLDKADVTEIIWWRNQWTFGISRLFHNQVQISKFWIADKGVSPWCKDPWFPTEIKGARTFIHHRLPRVEICLKMPWWKSKGLKAKIVEMGKLRMNRWRWIIRSRWTLRGWWWIGDLVHLRIKILNMWLMMLETIFLLRVSLKDLLRIIQLRTHARTATTKTHKWAAASTIPSRWPSHKAKTHCKVG